MSLEPGTPSGSKGAAWRAPMAVSVVLLLVSGGYLLVRSRSTATLPPREVDASGGSRGSRVEAYRQKAFSMHTSAARNWVRSQKTQSPLVMSAFS